MSTKRMLGATLALTTLLAMAMSTTGCVIVQTVEREERTDRQEVSLDGAEELVVDINMGAGQLGVRSDGRRVAAGDAMEAEFTYDVSSWEPIVEYDVVGDEGRLDVRQPNRATVGPIGDMRYEWDIVLTDDVPIFMSVDMGAGQASLDLSDADLRELDVNHGAGETTIDLTGRYRHDVEVTVQGGAGEINVHLPEGVGVRVAVDQGIGQIVANGFRMENGDYVNDAYEDADTFIDVDIDAGVGQINLILEG